MKRKSVLGMVLALMVVVITSCATFAKAQENADSTFPYDPTTNTLTIEAGTLDVEALTQFMGMGEEGSGPSPVK